MGLLIVSAIHLIPALFDGEIYTTKLGRPLTKAENPIAYKNTFAVMVAVGLVGLAILIFGALYSGS